MASNICFLCFVIHIGYTKNRVQVGEKIQKKKIKNYGKCENQCNFGWYVGINLDKKNLLIECCQQVVMKTKKKQEKKIPTTKYKTKPINHRTWLWIYP